ncbi:3-dehydroquinate synthase [Olsenella profusa]|uniref:3-dehydroquinate synthase n=1 Tax=Olsenella profusa TaxID=138595 RepID=A0ABS2F0K8_9ACTN|nr:3-dehydroquinate synthase [Olsenella profusa]MBM6774078.1 3-dehydroquinate synthase [Olsenella profusa]
MSERCDDTRGEKDPGVATRLVHVGASAAYDVHVGAGILPELGAVAREAAGGARCCVVSETHVAPLYADAAEASLAAAGYDVAERVVFPAGERHKRLSTLGEILEALAARELGRSDVVVALGGGVAGDVAGLAAALYLRGVAVVQVPTSLLAMVDSSVGGKTAVDLEAGKNLAGAFWQPCAVVADVRTLATVPDELFRDSCGEVVKHAVLADAALLDRLTERPLTKLRHDEASLVDVVARNVEIKRDVVQADEREAGVRQTLNLGHTIGHAIEAASEFTLGHGSCVAAGLCMMARASARRGWCSGETATRIERCVAAHGLPTGSELPADLLMHYMAHDKKRHGEAVNVVVPVEVGRCEVRRVGLDELRELVELGR